jgi:hypothetical protein
LIFSCSLRLSSATCVVGGGIFGGGGRSSDEDDEGEASPVGEYLGDGGLQGFGLRVLDLDLLSWD